VEHYFANGIEGNAEFGLHTLMTGGIAPIAIC
jgi:hypothetical protein